jgi:hypothetical protein
MCNCTPHFGQIFFHRDEPPLSTAELFVGVSFFSRSGFTLNRASF